MCKCPMCFCAKCGAKDPVVINDNPLTVKCKVCKYENCIETEPAIELTGEGLDDEEE